MRDQDDPADGLTLMDKATLAKAHKTSMEAGLCNPLAWPPAPQSKAQRRDGPPERPFLDGYNCDPSNVRRGVAPVELSGRTGTAAAQTRGEALSSIEAIKQAFVRSLGPTIAQQIIEATTTYFQSMANKNGLHSADVGGLELFTALTTIREEILTAIEPITNLALSRVHEDDE